VAKAVSQLSDPFALCEHGLIHAWQPKPERSNTPSAASLPTRTCGTGRKGLVASHCRRLPRNPTFLPPSPTHAPKSTEILRPDCACRKPALHPNRPIRWHGGRFSTRGNARSGHRPRSEPHRRHKGWRLEPASNSERISKFL
jgi:hypothetical protein